MGQKVSRHSKREQRREEEFRIQMTVQRVENFILLAYMIGTKLDSLKLILGCENARARFNDFLVRDQNAFELEYWCESRFLHTLPLDSLVPKGKDIARKYIRGSNGMHISLSYLNREKLFEALQSTNPSKTEIINALAAVEFEILSTLASSSWLRFLQSRSYINWRCQERGHVCALTAYDIMVIKDIPEYDIRQMDELLVDPHVNGGGVGVVNGPSPSVRSAAAFAARSVGSPTKSPKNATSRTSTVATTYDSISCGDPYKFEIVNPKPIKIAPLSECNALCISEPVRPLTPTPAVLYEKNAQRSDLSFCALNSMSSEDMHSLLASGSQWLLILLAGVEGVPLCVSLHSPKCSFGSNDPQFPFMYANRYYERTFNINRTELLAKSLGVLFKSQTDSSVRGLSEDHQVANIEKNKPTRVNGGIDGGGNGVLGIENEDGFELTTRGFKVATDDDMRDIYENVKNGVSCVFGRKMSDDLIALQPIAPSSPFSANGSNKPPLYRHSSDFSATGYSTKGVDQYNGLIVGMKPIYSNDNKTLLYVIVIQQEVTNPDNWVQGQKFIEDMLALIPENFDIRELEGSYSLASCSALGVHDKAFSSLSTHVNDGTNNSMMSKLSSCTRQNKAARKTIPISQ